MPRRILQAACALSSAACSLWMGPFKPCSSANVLSAASSRAPDHTVNGATALKLGLRQGLGTLGPQIVALPSSSALHTIGRAAKQPAWDALAPFLAVPR